MKLRLLGWLRHVGCRIYHVGYRIHRYRIFQYQLELWIRSPGIKKSRMQNPGYKYRIQAGIGELCIIVYQYFPIHILVTYTDPGWYLEDRSSISWYCI